MSTHRSEQRQYFNSLTARIAGLMFRSSLLFVAFFAAQDAPVNAQGYGAMNGSSSQSGAFSSEELAYLKGMCMTMYSEFLSIDKQRSQSSATQVSGSASAGVTGGSVSGSSAESQASASRDAKVSSSQGMTNCDGIVGSYFDYKKAQLQSESTRIVGLANADAIKSVGLANAQTNQDVGLANANALKAVGLANSSAQLYGGIAGAAGNLLGSIFTSGNQKAAIRAQAEADLAKTKVIADLELQKARLQYELSRAQPGYGAPPPAAQYQMPIQQYQQMAAPAYQGQPSYPAPSAYPAQQSYPGYSPQPVAQMQPSPNPAVMQASVASVQYQAPPSTIMAPQQVQGQAPGSLSDALRRLGLVQNSDCNPGAVIIFSRNGARVCAFAKSTLPPGQYLYEDGRLQKY